ncbi:hypothetical protein IEQ34_000291 [Dendrobium chrysotoxum]|uniref:CRIB domain-containing protein n=1 Tax=Dendrobium chrysotoxum TaxID=161865 RepID=A0AAV7HSR6_DENCH|nr:hypothetical protein IEQ34_000291 [Dendrobium chrysotoxum]
MEPQRRLEEAKFPSTKEKFLLPSAYMGAKMKKGIYKGLRYFSNIFDPKEQEMQIGYPTNVKHVAHIGWEGPSENAPSWMNDFRSAPLTTTVNEDPAEIPKFPSSEFILTGEPPRCLVPKSPEMKERAQKPPRRKKSSNEAATSSDSPKRESPSSNHYRRRQSRSRGSGSDSAEGSSRSRRESEAISGENEAPGIPKQSRRRRTKGSSSNSGGGGSASTQTSSRADGKDEERGDFLPQETKPAKGRKEEITSDFLGSARSPLTSS